VDHRERQIAPHSLAFNLTAQKLVVILRLFQDCTECLLQTLLRLRRCHRNIRSLSSWRGYPITYNSIQEEQRRFERSDIYYYSIYLDLQFAFTSKGSCPLWRFPHHTAQMNVFMPQAVSPQQIPTSQCSATPKRSLSCTSAVALVQVSPRYAVPSGILCGTTKPGISATIQSYETTRSVCRISRMWNGAGVQLGYSLGCGYATGDIPGIKRREVEIGR